MRGLTPSALLLVAALALTACPPVGLGPDSGPYIPPDASVPPDAGEDAGSPADAGRIDAGAPDASHADAAGADASAADAASAIDSGPGVDAGGIDAGISPDAGSLGDGGCAAAVVSGSQSVGGFASVDSAGIWASPTSWPGMMGAAPAVTSYPGGFLAAFPGPSQTLMYVTYGMSWSAPAQVASALAIGQASLAVLGSDVHVVYWGADRNFYHGTFSAGAWDSANDPVGGATSQSFGVSAPTAVATAVSLEVAQTGEDTVLYSQTWTGGAWAHAVAIGGVAVEPTESPRLLALQGGAADLLLVAPSQLNRVLYYSVRTAGAWSTLNLVHDSSTYSPDAVALAALGGGQALMVYWGGDTQLYYSVYNPVGSWTPPAAVFSPNPNVASLPSLAPDVCGNGPLLAWVLPGTGVQTSNWFGGAWTNPVTVTGAGGLFVAAATRP
jgi:hypothetical protein